MLLMIDNYDSFTYNVVQYFGELKVNVEVVRNDEITIANIAQKAPDYLVISPGPCTPSKAGISLGAIEEYAGKLPILGICLGHQLLALASGAKTMKMKFGHHGANHPVQDIDTGVVMITSQNHGFAVDQESLPDNLRTTHVSLFDRSLQAVHRTDKPAFSFQGHPEASPGPHDVAPLFNHFFELIEAHINQKADRPDTGGAV